jgi:rhamnosyltransferase
MRCRCAGIVLYNPEIKRLRENVAAIQKQVDSIILIDNCSKNSDYILKEYEQFNDIVIIKNNENKGIAFALNQICDKAIDMGFDWVLLLDQDSVCSPNIISTFEKYILEKDVALLTPYIVDINKISLEEYEKIKLSETSLVDWAITSGSLIKLSVWKKIGGFYNELFIDAVDIDYSRKLEINGYKQLRVNKEYLLQEVGRAEPTPIIRLHKDNAGKWTVKRYFRTNHSLLRQYYMTRNNIILAKKYRRYKSIWKGVIFVIIMSLPKLFVEKNKMKLFKTLVKGFYDGYKFKVENYIKLV